MDMALAGRDLKQISLGFELLENGVKRTYSNGLVVEVTCPIYVIKHSRTSYHMLRASLKQSKLIVLNAKDSFENAAKDNIFLTSATKHKGIQELAEFIRSIQRNNLGENNLSENKQSESKKPKDIENFYLQKTVQELYGKFGLDILSQEQESIKQLTGYEEKMTFAITAIEQRILGR